MHERELTAEGTEVRVPVTLGSPTPGPSEPARGGRSSCSDLTGLIRGPPLPLMPSLIISRVAPRPLTQVTFATHLLSGVYLLSSLALPLLERSADPRVVMVSSGGMYTTKLPDWPTLSASTPDAKFDGTLAYAYAKRGQVHFLSPGAQPGLLGSVLWHLPGLCQSRFRYAI